MFATRAPLTYRLSLGLAPRSADINMFATRAPLTYRLSLGLAPRSAELELVARLRLEHQQVSVRPIVQIAKELVEGVDSYAMCRRWMT